MLFINNVCKEIVQSRKIVIKSNPLIKRDFVPVIDFCEIIVKICEHRFKNKEKNILNFGSEKTVSLIDSADLIKKIYFEKYHKEVPIILKREMEIVNDFRICNQILEENNLNVKFKKNTQKEIKSLLEKCFEYFAI